MRSCCFAFLASAFLLLACDGEPPSDDDILWDPPLTTASGGDLDMGLVPEGQMVQGQIVGINNTTETFTFTVDVDLPTSEGWLISSPPPMDVAPEESIAIGPRFQPNPSTPSESTGTITFFYDDEVVTYLVRAGVEE
ncbi:MAG: hypothetical protein VX498_15685 [Myxococcota bacterium]|nr:hypothetical protein [Myxococcota bacterium]